MVLSSRIQIRASSIRKSRSNLISGLKICSFLVLYLWSNSILRFRCRSKDLQLLKFLNIAQIDTKVTSSSLISSKSMNTRLYHRQRFCIDSSLSYLGLANLTPTVSIFLHFLLFKEYFVPAKSLIVILKFFWIGCFIFQLLL